MDGAVVGLDIAACLARPSAKACDAPALEFLLAAAEPAIVSALNAHRRES